MGTTPTVVKTIVDAGTWSKSPTTNYSNVTRNGICNGAGNISEIFYYWARPFPLGVTIISAKLVFFNQNSYGSSVTFSAARVTSKWDSTRLTYNAKPSVAGQPVFTATKASAPYYTKWEIDITSAMQTVSNGGVWYGMKLWNNSTGYNYIWSPQAPDPNLRPYMVITWSDAPKAPSTLSPSNGRAVSIDKPTLSFNFTDLSGDTTLQAVRVQTNPTNSFTAPAWDSGVVPASEPELDLSRLDLPTPYPGLAADATAWWRVQVQDGAGLWSSWSNPTSFVRKLKGTLTLNNPPTGVIRTNYSPNPAYRSTAGLQTVRLNRVFNPGVRDNANYMSSNPGNNTMTAVRVVGSAGYGPTLPSGQILNTYKGTITAAGTTPNGASVGPSIGSSGADQLNVVAGKKTNYSVYFRCLKARTVALVLTYSDAAGVAVGSQVTGPSVVLPAAQWTRLTLNDTPPAGATRAVIRVYPVGTNVDWAVNDWWEVTGWLVENDTATALEYFDGDTPNSYYLNDGSAWTTAYTGAAGASPSAMQGPLPNLGSPRAYATTSWYGAKDGNSDAYRMVYLGGTSVAGSIMAWLDGATGLPVMVAGEYYAAKIQMRIVAGGQSMSISPRLAIYQPAFHSYLTDVNNDTVVVPADGTWTDLLLTSALPVPSGLTSPTPRTMLYVNTTNPPVGTVVELRYHIIEKVPGAGQDVGSYFDGSTAESDNSYDYAWVGTADASASTLSRSYVSEATPPIDWTFAGNGRTQKAYSVTISDAEATEKRLWTTGKITGTTTAVTVPDKIIKSNLEDYRVVVAIWDEIDREAVPNDTPYTSISRVFQYVYDSTINVATNLQAVQNTVFPWVTFTWQRDTMPDKWNIYRNGKLITTKMGQDLVVPGTTMYRYVDLLPEPRKQNTYAAIPIVNGKGAAGNPTAYVTPVPLSITLSDDNGTYPVVILNADWDADLQEESEVFAPAGDGPPILITQNERGFQGKVEGRLSQIEGYTSDYFLNNYKQLIKYNGQTLLLTLVNDSFLCFIRNATYRPIAGPGWTDAIVSFEFYQTDYVR